MSKPPRDHHRDPMAREVDRLLAQLTNPGHPAARNGGSRGDAPTPILATFPRAPGVAAAPTGASGDGAIALWARVVLGLALGGVMTQWPYAHGCGWQLAGYLGAVAMVMLAGGWIAFASWRQRSGPAHLLSLLLLYWGIVLAAEQLLPRLGYAADQASWGCPLVRTASHSA
jgi:hypothetical protein